MNKNVKVVLRNGTEVSLAQWQKIYDLPIDSDQIGRHFHLCEKRFVDDLELYGVLVVNELLMIVLDSFRDAVGVPITLNSFNRTEAHQIGLKKLGLKAATHSPHVVKLAADIETKTPDQTREWVKILLQVANILKIDIRVGFEQYLAAGQTFIHVDVCPEYYKSGRPFNNQFHPEVWTKQITW